MNVWLYVHAILKEQENRTIMISYIEMEKLMILVYNSMMENKC